MRILRILGMTLAFVWAPLSAGVSVTISPTSTTIFTAGTKQFTATVSGTSNTAVTWTCTGGTVVNGLYTAPSTPGTYTVKATSVANTRQSASATVTVTAPTGITVSISPSTTVVVQGGNQQFAATITGTGWSRKGHRVRG